jgi:hypothetical protein
MNAVFWDFEAEGSTLGEDPESFSDGSELSTIMLGTRIKF